ncbi:MAG TPA: hypothetical protein VMI10_20665 [Terriglobales bacterium]|nr:hypothetical protein [Terriglobales bacterium]
MKLRLKGSTGLIIAIAVVVILLVAMPGYWLFFGISVVIGVVIAGGLKLWHRMHPIKDVEVENKKPLGL